MYDVENARQRDGDAAEDRSDQVDEILNRPRLGHGESDPLVGDDCGEYPATPDDLTTPEARQFVTELFEHDKVNSVRDAIEETTPATRDRQIVSDWRKAFERASELFGVSTPEGAEPDENDTDDRLTELTGDTFPADMRDPSNPLVVAELYAGLGLSTEEIAGVFNDASDTLVKPSRIRRTLRSTGLIRADPSENREPSYRLGGTTIDMSAVQRSDGVTLERGEQADD